MSCFHQVHWTNALFILHRTYAVDKSSVSLSGQVRCYTYTPDLFCNMHCAVGHAVIRAPMLGSAHKTLWPPPQFWRAITEYHPNRKMLTYRTIYLNMFKSHKSPPLFGFHWQSQRLGWGKVGFLSLDVLYLCPLAWPHPYRLWFLIV